MNKVRANKLVVDSPYTMKIWKSNGQYVLEQVVAQTVLEGKLNQLDNGSTMQVALSNNSEILITLQDNILTIPNDTASKVLRNRVTFALPVAQELPESVAVALAESDEELPEAVAAAMVEDAEVGEVQEVAEMSAADKKRMRDAASKRAKRAAAREAREVEIVAA